MTKWYIDGAILLVGLLAGYFLVSIGICILLHYTVYKYL